MLLQKFLFSQYFEYETGRVGDIQVLSDLFVLVITKRTHWTQGIVSESNINAYLLIESTDRQTSHGEMTGHGDDEDGTQDKKKTDLLHWLVSQWFSILGIYTAVHLEFTGGSHSWSFIPKEQ